MKLRSLQKYLRYYEILGENIGEIYANEAQKCLECALLWKNSTW